MKTNQTALRLAAAIALMAGSLGAQTDQPRAVAADILDPNGSIVFSIRDASLTATSRIPIFRAALTNRSGADWDSVSLAISVDIDCDSVPAKHVDFVASIGDLNAGESRISDTIFPAMGMLSSGCVAHFLTFSFKRGARLSAQDTVEREAARARLDAELEDALLRLDTNAILARQEESKCRAVFAATIDRKVADLTVRESQLVGACTGLGYYHD